MYTDHFGFEDVPFTQLSDPRHVFVSAQFEEVRAELVDALREQARIVLLTGHSGTGKTKLLSHIRALLEEQRPVFYLPYSALMIEDFIEYAAGAMRMDFAAGHDIFESFQEGLSYIAEGGMRPILLIDDGHNLGADVLENLIGLFKLAPGESPLAQLVIAAHPEIDYLLERSELTDLEENLARLSRMQPLQRKEVSGYIDFALRTVGYEGAPVFTQDALEAIATHTHCVPEMINSLCGASFLIAAGRDENPVSRQTVDAAIEEVAVSAMADTIESRPQTATGEDWYLDFDDIEPGTPKLPGIVQAWLKRSRRWPIAAVGVGSSIALTAVLVLVGTLPFGENTAEAHQRNLNAELAAQVEQLQGQVLEARVERERLEAELDARAGERDTLAGKLARLEDRVLAEQGLDIPDTKMGTDLIVSNNDAEVIVTPLNTKSSTPKLDSAEALLAELMQSAEKEADEIAATLDESNDVVAIQTVAQPTQKQAVQESAPNARSYVVQKGDTLWSIAQRHNTKVETILAANGMADGTALLVGQVLRFDGTAPVVTKTKSAVAQPLQTSVNSNQQIAMIEAAQKWYVVEPGDSLFGIGRKFAASVDELKEWNGLAANGDIRVGQKLRLVPNTQ